MVMVAVSVEIHLDVLGRLYETRDEAHLRHACMVG